MGTTASQVRQDFNCIGDVNGRQGIGYSVENLLSILEHLLFGNGDLLLPSSSAAAVWARL